ncbi:hypothetical protein BDR07DRAFT_1006212 [Suillus spraguei]|nr:hypothetical protein BDR07DRAFT_1006212 [Suillus spraguei]
MYYALNGTNSVVFTMLDIIMIARLHAMYQRSRVMLIFFVIIFLAIMIACAVFMVIGLKDTAGKEELILPGTYVCSYRYKGDFQFLFTMVWTLSIVWEVLALCFAVWVAVKHFHSLRQFGPSTGSTIGDCFRVLIKYHVLFFASFVCICCIQLGSFSPELFSSNAIGELTLDGVLQILLCIQMFILGPRLILSVREHHAKLVANSDAEISMNSIAFQEAVHVPTSSTV